MRRGPATHAGDLKGTLSQIPTLTREEFEELHHEAAVALIRARFDALVHAGCGLEPAAIFAVHPEVKVADALRLLRLGCPPRTALRILL